MNRPGRENTVRLLPVLEAIHNHIVMDSVFLHFDTSESEGRNELYRFSVVCKSFSGPALRRLWACMHSCEPLLQLLPGLQEMNNELVRLFVADARISI
jgi:hypothetical protein